MRLFLPLILLLTACQQEDQTPRLVENCIPAYTLPPNALRISDGNISPSGYAQLWVRNSTQYYLTSFYVCASNPARQCQEEEFFLPQNSETYVAVTFPSSPIANEAREGPRHFSIELRGMACQLTSET